MKLSNDMEAFGREAVEKFQADYAEFCQYQTQMQNTLKAFAEVCDKYGIRYYLAYGSLLGAVRNGGQIPWDYDIDVWVPFEQAQQLMDALDRELAEEYHYITRFKDKSYRTYTLKLAPKAYDPEVMHVDVFWLTGLPADDRQIEKRNALHKKYSRLMNYKYTPRKYMGVQGRAGAIYYAFQSRRAKLYSARYLDRIYRKLTAYSTADSEKWTALGDVCVLEKQWFDGKRDIGLANGYRFSIPGGTEDILRACYGDYMRYPPIDSRIKEFNTALARIRKLAKIDS